MTAPKAFEIPCALIIGGKYRNSPQVAYGEDINRTQQPVPAHISGILPDYTRKPQRAQTPKEAGESKTSISLRITSPMEDECQLATSSTEDYEPICSTCVTVACATDNH